MAGVPTESGTPAAAEWQLPAPRKRRVTVKGAHGVLAHGDRFTDETGVPLVVETPDPLGWQGLMQHGRAWGPLLEPLAVARVWPQIAGFMDPAMKTSLAHPTKDCQTSTHASAAAVPR